MHERYLDAARLRGARSVAATAAACAIFCTATPSFAADAGLQAAPPAAPAAPAFPAAPTAPGSAGASGFPAAPSAPASAGAPLPPGTDYRIHGNDQLRIDVFNEQSLSQVTSVLPDGTITFPLAGRIFVSGLTTQGAAAKIATALNPYVKKPNITVTVATPAQYTVLVLGNVKLPGRYLVRSDARITDALAAAGGLGPVNGEYPQARVTQANAVPKLVSLQKLFRQGDTNQNLELADGAVVYVPSPVTIDVEVVGAVDHPGSVTINEGDRLSMAIARAGNSSNSSADLNHLRITRMGANGKSEIRQINLYDTLERGDMSVDIPLQKGDVVYVPQSNRQGRSNSQSGFSALFLLGRLVGL